MLHAMVAAFLYTFEKLTANDIYIKGVELAIRN
jgi:hypothetical protein